MKNFKKYIFYTLFLLNFTYSFGAMKRPTGLNVSASGILPISAINSIASEDDIPQLLDLMDRIEDDADDSKLLVIVPRAMREEVLREAIAKKHIYVTKNIEGYIISFLKLYLINTKIKHDKSLGEYVSELATILTKELRCCTGTPGNLTSLPSKKRHYHNVRSAAPLFEKCREDECFLTEYTFEPHDRQTFIYYGGAYTIPDFRGKGYGSDLLKHALNSMIANKILPDINYNASTELILAYGQAAANKERKLMLRQFTQIISVLHAMLNIPSNSSYSLRHEIFNAYVPAFDEAGNLLPDSDERKGFGNLVIYKLP